MAFVRTNQRMQRLLGSPTICGSSSKSVGMARKRGGREFKRSLRGLAMLQLIGIQTCRRVARNIGRSLPLRNHRMIRNTVSSCFLLCYFPYTTCAVAIFRTYRSDDEVEPCGEYPDPVFKFLDRNNPSPPTKPPPRKRKGLGYLLRKIFGPKSEH